MTAPPIQSYEIRVGCTHYVLHQDVDAVLEVDVPELRIPHAGVGEGVVVGVDEFSEGVEAVELMEDI